MQWTKLDMYKIKASCSTHSGNMALLHAVSAAHKLTFVHLWSQPWFARSVFFLSTIMTIALTPGKPYMTA